MQSTKTRTLMARLLGLLPLARLATALVVVAAVFGLAYSAAIALSAAAPAPHLEASAEWAAPAGVSPTKPPAILVPRLGNTLAGAMLYKVTRDAAGRVGDELIPTRLTPAGEAQGFGGWNRLVLLKADGSSPLAYDGEYRLNLATTTLAPSLPLPRVETTTKEYAFKTLLSPHLTVPPGLVQLRFGEPLKINWDAPVEEFAVQTVPAATAKTWVDPNDKRVGYVALTDTAPGTRYEVQVREARSANGAPLLAPATLSVQTPASPRPATENARLENGFRVVLPWDQPLASFTYEVSPPVTSRAEVDATDPRLSYIVLQGPKQKQKYEFKITGAVSTLGAPLADGQGSFSVTTPPALSVAKLSPRGTEIGVKRDSAISIRFSEPIRDRAQAEAAVSFAPALAGRFDWPEPDRLRFVPKAPLPPLTKINVRIAGGTAGATGQSGAYFAEPYEYAFTTQPNKLIDVDLSRQRITLLEDGKAVFTAPVATGVRGAETPTGQFLVTLKWPTLRMRGTNPSGISYDIPNVPWVMSFLGDYTFHGAPWRNQFGTPLSNGCVSMETSVAKRVYDWTPPGTPVRIHY